MTQPDLEQLLETFPDQPLDFYGAIRCGQESRACRLQTSVRNIYIVS